MSREYRSPLARKQSWDHEGLDRQLSTAGFAEGKGQPGREGAQRWVCKPELEDQVDRDGGLMAEGDSPDGSPELEPGEAYGVSMRVVLLPNNRGRVLWGLSKPKLVSQQQASAQGCRSGQADHLLPGQVPVGNLSGRDEPLQLHVTHMMLSVCVCVTMAGRHHLTGYFETV